MSFEVTILGASSATPTSSRNVSAQLVHLLGRFFLFDCGEGTQIQLRRFGVKIQKINYICISHLHGDHYLGLIGLLSTMSLLNRNKELIIFAPKGLESILNLHLKLSYSVLSFPLKFIALNTSKMKKIFEDDTFELFSFGLKHRIPCWGFKLLEKKRPRNVFKGIIEKHKIPYSAIESIKSGEDYTTDSGQVLPNKLLTSNPYSPRSYAYCSDTMPFDDLINYILDVDLLYHDSTFHSNLAEKAKFTFHSTAKQAGIVASKANVKKLILGHFSSRYKNLDILKKDAQSKFKNVDIAIEGKTWIIKKTYD